MSMPNYTISQLDDDGNVLSEITVEATQCSSALRLLPGLATGCNRIVVMNSEGERAGEVGAEFWRRRIRRR